jgi:thiamine-phosphate pyrophosphorylase
MLVTDRRRTRGRDLVKLVAESIQGGVRLVQVREPDLADDALRELVQRLREASDALGDEVRWVVNARQRVARTMHLGLHLPADAEPFDDGSRRLPLRGRSAHDEQEAMRALRERVDYLVLGTIFATPSKPGLRPAGIALIERVRRLLHPLPILAIGGITIGRIPAALHAGAYGVAVCGAILEDNHPGRVAGAMNLALDVVRRSLQSGTTPLRGSASPEGGR